eukprot:96660-Heterocapsa_arctica.AAC.1
MAHRPGKELLVDPGSPDNLVGDKRSQRQAALSKVAGVAAPSYKDIPPFNVGGVGKGSQVCNQRITHAIALESQESG